jgi:hypothetical protein
MDDEFIKGYWKKETVPRSGYSDNQRCGPP